VKIVLVDYGAGNLPSVERALARLGAETQRAASAAEIESAEAIVLPGVGHFAAMMRALEKQDVLAALRASLKRSIPFLGICVGLQALYQSSEEAPDTRGLGVFDETVRKLPATSKLPHMGWNTVQESRPGSVLLRGIPAGTYFYFAHSYAAPGEGAQTVAKCDHAANFGAVIEQGNILAVQFHPEKSGDAGARVLRNFLEFAR
jgi:imidazole glycerol phosphate synthase glutamine amidotransferase subunit